MWCAHCVHLSRDDVADFAAERDGRRALPDVEPPPRRGHRSRPRRSLDAGVRVGLGVDGSASNERSDLLLEVKQALLVARGSRRAARADGARARCASARAAAPRFSAATTSARSSPANAPTSRSGGRTSLELGGAEDLVAGLVLSAPHRVDRLVVGGEDVVRGGALVHADETRSRGDHRVAGAKIRVVSVSVSTHVLDTGTRRAGG